MLRRVIASWIGAIAVTTVASAGVTDINGVYQRPAPLHNTAAANPLVVTDNFPTSYTVSQTGLEGFDDVQFWSKTYLFFFSEDGGTTPRPFLESEAFDISFDLTIDSPLATPRKAAGFGMEGFVEGFGTLRPQYVVRTNQDNPRPAGTDPGFGTGLPGGSLIAGTPLTFNPEFDGSVTYEKGQTINLRMIYTPTVRDEQEQVLELGKMEFIADIVGDGISALTTGPVDMNVDVPGVADGFNIGFRTQAWAGLSAAGDSYSVNFANFQISDPNAMGLPGDYNENNVVDAADYTVWRDKLGQSIALPNEGETPGQVTIEDYNFWKSHFGQTSGSGAGGVGLGSSVPEPAAVTLLLAACVLGCPRFRKN